MAFKSGVQRKKDQILRGTETILRNREYKITKFKGTEEQANLFQRKKVACTPREGFSLYYCYFPMWYPGSGVVLDCIVS